MICSCYCCNKDLFALGGSARAGIFRGGGWWQSSIEVEFNARKVRVRSIIRN